MENLSSALLSGGKKEAIGEYRVGCAGNNPNPTNYGKFVSGKLQGIQNDLVRLKLTISEDEVLLLEYL